MNNNIAHFPETVNTLLEWGRRQPTSHTVASEQFTPQATDQLRRYLRTEYQAGNKAVVGCWREGYELTAGHERIGVTNGHGSFKIYYRRSQLNGYGKATADAIPFDGSYPVDNSWIEDNHGLEVDDYAIEAAI